MPWRNRIFEAIEGVYLVEWESSRRCNGAESSRMPDGLGSFEELKELAMSAGARVLGSAFQRSSQPDPATLVGRGKLEQIRLEARALSVRTVIFGHDLTPTQLRNLEEALDLRVIDRTQLILDIFARRARTREGKLQVELAQLTYLLPRLAGHGTRLSRLGGGIGTRGPGEQQLEFDRRRVRARIQRLQDALERVRSQRGLHREHRRKQQLLNVALVGYTNAGKSTLFNALTGSNVPVSSRLFATLDPTVRLIQLESRREVLLSDTVGFIRHLPAHLVAAFRATLEELESADLLLHITDASSPDCEEQDRAVSGLLEHMGLASAPLLHVWNKVDRIPEPGLRRPASETEIAVSALTGEGIPELLRRIDRALVPEPAIETEFEFSSSDGKTLALLLRAGSILSTQYLDHSVRIRARVTESLRAQVASSLSIEAGRLAE